METLFSRLTTQVYELEGLLLVMDKHGEDTPEVVYQRIAELGEQIAARCQQLGAEHSDITPETPAPTKVDRPTEPAEAAHEPTDAASDDLPEKDYDADETWQHDNGKEFAEVFKLDYVEPDTTVITQPEPAPAVEQPNNVQTSEPQHVEHDLRVDEKLHRDISKDMHKAMSINDRFRFKRELFGNSDEALERALTLVNDMDSFEQAQEHFIYHLGWDQDNEDVADFMGLVRRHFL